MKLTIPRAARAMAPMIMSTVWMKSVQMTAARPPATVNRAAMARRIRMET